MVTTSKAYKGMRAFVDALESLQTSGLYRVTSQRPRQSGLRLPLHRSTFATTSAAEPFFTSSKSAVSSTGIGKPSAKTTKHRLPNKAPPLDPKRRERANTSHKPESNPDNPITEEEGKGPTALHTSHSAKSWGRMKGSARKSSVDHRAQSANPNPSQQLLKQDFVDDWFFGVVKEKGWLPTRSFIPPAEGSIGQFDYHLSRPDAAESWKVSVWEDTEEQARRKAIPQIFAKVYRTCNWNKHPGTESSASDEYLRCLKMIVDNRLVLTISKQRHPTENSFWFIGWINVPEMKMHVRLNRCIPEDRETSTVALSSVIMEVVSVLCREGIWQNLLKMPAQPRSLSSPNELVSEMGDLTAPELTKSETADPSGPLTRESIKELLKAFFRARRKWPERFHNEMASVNLQAIVRDNWPGTTTCHALYNCPLGEPIKGGVVLDPSRLVLRSQLESMAIGLILPKLESSGIWDKFLEVNYAPSLFLSDDMVWRINETRSQLLKTEQWLKRTMLQDKDIQKFSSYGQNRTKEGGVRLQQIVARSKELKGLLRELEQSRDPEVVAIQAARAELPVSQRRDELLQLINQNTYSVISAETGSGKSTQIPQIILDDAIRKGKGGECRVLCVQPRRVAAELLGERVAVERNEIIGETVGYEVRFQCKTPVQDGNIMYCTTGILLNMFANGGKKLESLTHIMLDEVHVRDTEIDFIMLLLKRHVDKCRAAGTRAPQIVIMSATVDRDLFSSYFKNIGPDGNLIPAPSLSISGRQYHVEQHYLDDILGAVARTFEFKPQALSDVLAGEGETSAFLNNHYKHFGDIEEPESTTSNSLMETHVTPSALEESDTVPIGLISALVFHLLLTTRSGSILIFLPGMSAIEILHTHLLSCAESIRSGKFSFDFRNEDQFRILKLHSELKREMEKLAEPFPEGCRRIFLSTDIAEASVTLPDVKYVIDSGKLNLASYDSAAQSHRLTCNWVGKSNAIQRAGRAGRVQNGHYYFLGTKRRYDSLQRAVTPAISRDDLHTVCLRAKVIDRDVPVAQVLQQAIEPPSLDKISDTVKSLKLMKAFDESERLTALGSLMSRIGVTALGSKLIILGVIFRCLDPLLVLAVQVEKGSLFRSPTVDTIAPILASRRTFAAESQSDNIAEINAFNALRSKYKESAAWDFADSNHLQMRVYLDIYQTASLILQSLSAQQMIGLADSEMLDPFGGPDLNVNSENTPLLNALIAHCLSGQLALPHPTSPQDFLTSTAGYTTIRGISLARSHPDQPQQLVAASLKRSYPWKKSNHIITDASVVTPFNLCLLGENLTWDGELLRVDSWLPIRLKAEDVYTTKQAAQSLVKLNEQFHTLLGAAYDLYHAKRWGRATDEKHLEYLRARRVATTLLPQSINSILSLSKPRPTSEPQSTWNIWKLLEADFEAASTDERMIPSPSEIPENYSKLG